MPKHFSSTSCSRFRIDEIGVLKRRHVSYRRGSIVDIDIRCIITSYKIVIVICRNITDRACRHDIGRHVYDRSRQAGSFHIDVRDISHVVVIS